MASMTGSASPAAQNGRTTSEDDHHVSPSDIAVGVVIALQVARLPVRVTAGEDGQDEGPEALLQALRAAHWNVSAVARAMGLSRMTLHRRMKRAGIVPPNRMV